MRALKFIAVAHLIAAISMNLFTLRSPVVRMSVLENHSSKQQGMLPLLPRQEILGERTMARQVAYLLLDKVVSFNHSAVLDALRTRYPDVPLEPVSDSDRPGGLPDGALLFRFGGDLIVVMTMAMPVPKEEWERASLRAKAAWTEAPAAFADHHAHLVVSILAEPSDRLKTARALSAVVGGLISVVPGCRAVLWEALVAHRPEFWDAASRDAFAPYPKFPYPLWVSLHPFADNGKVGVISFGLSSFIGREIELEPQNTTPAEATHKAAGLAVYLLEHGATLKDGDTFGATQAERIRIRHEVSKRVPGLAVLHAVPGTEH